MQDKSNQQTAAELLQELGLKEYEARCFVALSRRPSGTAKAISEISEVPRTRVYDAVRVLESKGLVEVQHSNPKQFRAVPIDEAIETIRVEFEERTGALRTALQGLEPAEFADETEGIHEVWALSGTTSISGRVGQLIDEAEREVILVTRHEHVDEEVIGKLRAASDRGIDVAVGTWDGTSRDRIGDQLPDIEVFVSDLEWLTDSPFPQDTSEIGRLLLVDQSTILVSSVTDGETADERAVFGRGFDNGLVVVVRRLMAAGLASGVIPEE
jgi:DNA-binding MarR family transcriptional regulator